jgi:hypothetical protein
MFSTGYIGSSNWCLGTDLELFLTWLVITRFTSGYVYISPPGFGAISRKVSDYEVYKLMCIFLRQEPIIFHHSASCFLYLWYDLFGFSLL